jgi:hypothetical protein
LKFLAVRGSEISSDDGEGEFEAEFELVESRELKEVVVVGE